METGRQLFRSAVCLACLTAAWGQSAHTDGVVTTHHQAAIGGRTLQYTAMKVFLVAGMYDSLNSCADNNYLVAHLQPEFRRNITQGCYRGGHMMYDTKEARYNLKRDAAAFIQNAGK